MLAIASIAVVVPAGAAAERAAPRVEEQRYLWPNGVRTTHYQEPLEALPEPPGLVFEPRPAERWIRVDLRDDHADFVYAHVHQPGTNGRADLDMPICSGRSVIALVSSEPVEIRFYSGLCENHIVGVATQGTARVTYFTRPPAPNLTPAHKH